MLQNEWNLSIDGQLEDEPLVRIDDVNWGEAKNFGLDPDMVGLSVGTEHIDAKIELSRILIDIHNEHVEADGPSNVKGLVPEKIMDRLVCGMVVAGSGNSTIPNVLLRLLCLRMGVSSHSQRGIQDPVAYRNLVNFVAKNPNIGKKKTAEAVGISPNTAKKWMSLPEFDGLVDQIREKGTKGVN